MSEWYTEKNSKNGFFPTEITCGSDKRVWWKCANNHEWEERIEVRNRGYRCPYCVGKRPIIGKNDFATVHPELLNEWEYSKNIFQPQDLLPNSMKKVFWKCEKGHIWSATLNSRHKGSGCPQCSKEANSSFPEIAILFYLNQCFPVCSRKKFKGKEIDIFIPSLNMGIEYDGQYYHTTEKARINDAQKTELFKSLGLFFVRIIEATYIKYDYDNQFLYVNRDSDYTYLHSTINDLLQIINRQFNTSYSIDVNIERDHISILELYKSIKKKNSLLLQNPTLANEWDYEKNGDLLPEFFDNNSRHKVWWRCSYAHSWNASIYSRNKGNGCPICANHKVLIGFNDLATIMPQIAKEWNYEKNTDCTPEQITAKSDKTVWWKCSKGHEWQARISNRSHGNNCPYCANKRVLAGYNDLKTWCLNNNMSFLIHEFDYEKNEFDITEVSPFSGKKIWWKCSQKHSYLTQLTHRTQMGTSCPYCSHKRLLSGYNDLATTHPEIAKEWDYSKNDGIHPSEVMAGSIKRKYWFICSNGHSYSSTLLNRKQGNHCPFCRQARSS